MIFMFMERAGAQKSILSGICIFSGTWIIAFNTNEFHKLSEAIILRMIRLTMNFLFNQGAKVQKSLLSGIWIIAFNTDACHKLSDAMISLNWAWPQSLRRFVWSLDPLVTIPLLYIELWLVDLVHHYMSMVYICYICSEDFTGGLK